MQMPYIFGTCRGCNGKGFGYESNPYIPALFPTPKKLQCHLCVHGAANVVVSIVSARRTQAGFRNVFSERLRRLSRCYDCGCASCRQLR